MTARELLRKALKEIGADGLVSERDICGCGLDNLAPCDYLNPDCQAAKLGPAPEGDEFRLVDKWFYPMEDE
jgi:hypothetical protein